MSDSIVTLTTNTEYTGLQSIPGTTATYNIQGLSKHFGIDENTLEREYSVSGKGKTGPGVEKCATKAIVTEDIKGDHQFLKLLWCGKEWCHDCGESDSPAHLSRINRKVKSKTGKKGLSAKQKFQQIAIAGKIVIEWPLYRRHEMESKAALEAAFNTAVNVLAGKRAGRKGRDGGLNYDRGYARFHFHGDYSGMISGHDVALNELKDRCRYRQSFIELLPKLKELGVSNCVIGYNSDTLFIENNINAENALEIERLILRFTKAYRLKIKPYSEIRYNPHLNITVDGGYLPDDELEDMKDRFKSAFECDDLIVRYSYVSEPGQIYSWLKYTMRSTFRDYNWNPELARELTTKYVKKDEFGDAIVKDNGEFAFQSTFRNGRWWGKWDKPEVWQLDKKMEANVDAMAAAELISEGICPECYDQLKPWSQPIPLKIIEKESVTLTEYGSTGFYKITPDREGQKISIKRLMLLSELHNKAVAAGDPRYLPVHRWNIDNYDLETAIQKTRSEEVYNRIYNYWIDEASMN